MEKRPTNIFEVAMRFATIPLLCLMIIIILPGLAWSQDHIGCDDLTKSSRDSLRMSFFEGKPGDTVYLPVWLAHDSIVTAFQFLIEFDTTYLSPVFEPDSFCVSVDSVGNCLQWNIDSTFVLAKAANRFVDTVRIDDGFGGYLDTITKLTSNMFQGSENVIAANFLPAFNDIDSLLPPNPSLGQSPTDPIFYIAFNVSPAMPQDSVAVFTFFETDIFTIDSTIQPHDTTFIDGCNGAQMTTIWALNQDSSATFQVYPNIVGNFPYFFRADTAAADTLPDPTISILATPSTITEGQTSSVAWNSTESDSVIVTENGNRVSSPGFGSISGSLTISGKSQGTYTYIATAYGNLKTRVASTVLIVQPGGGGGGPTIAISGAQGLYNEGDLISFSVSSTNTTSVQITISAGTLPNGAEFGIGGSVTGFSPLSGNFAWTPAYGQAGFYTISFTASDANGSSTSSVGFTVEGLQFDRLFSTSAPGNRPVGGLPGTGGVAFPIDLVTTQTVYGIQFDMFYPSATIRVDSFVTTGRIPEYVVYDNLGDTPGQVRVVTLGLANEPVLDTNTTAILEAILTIDSTAGAWEDYVIYLDNGRESIDPDPGVGSLPLVTDSGIVQIDSLGDVNLDRSIDVADAVNVVAYVIGNFGLTTRQFDVADVIVDAAVNVFDLVGVINSIYGVPLPSPAPPAPGVEAVVSLDYQSISGGTSDLLVISSEVADPVEAVAGVQLEISYDPASVEFGTPQIADLNEKFGLQSHDDGNGKLRIMLYHLAPSNTDELIQTGATNLVKIPITAFQDIDADDKTKIRLSEAMMATSSAAAVAISGVDAVLPTHFALRQNYPNPFNPTTTIEFAIGVGGNGDQRVTLDVFNILGQNVSTLVDEVYPPGEYRVVWDATDQEGHRVATGVYLYRLTIGHEHQTKKMLLLK